MILNGSNEFLPALRAKLSSHRYTRVAARRVAEKVYSLKALKRDISRKRREFPAKLMTFSPP